MESTSCALIHSSIHPFTNPKSDILSALEWVRHHPWCWEDHKIMGGGWLIRRRVSATSTEWESVLGQAKQKPETGGSSNFWSRNKEQEKLSEEGTELRAGWGRCGCSLERPGQRGQGVGVALQAGSLEIWGSKCWIWESADGLEWFTHRNKNIKKELREKRAG